MNLNLSLSQTLWLGKIGEVRSLEGDIDYEAVSYVQWVSIPASQVLMFTS